MAEQGNGWTQWERYVVGSLNRHDAKLDTLDERLQRIDRDLATLKGNARAWGGIAGFIAGAAVAWVPQLLQLLK